MGRLPPWIRLQMRTDGSFADVHDLVSDLSLHTVCQSARCPNIHECWGHGTATLMLLGEVCTRACAFCAIQAGRPGALDAGEPARVAEAARSMNLRHVVLTSVARDDVPDGGAGIFAATIRAIRAELPEASIEVLTPDFEGVAGNQDRVLRAGVDVYNHNLETVRRLQSTIRPQASYGRSLGMLKRASEAVEAPAIKSGLMLGLGETDRSHDDASCGCQYRGAPGHDQVQRGANPRAQVRLSRRRMRTSRGRPGRAAACRRPSARSQFPRRRSW